MSGFNELEMESKIPTNDPNTRAAAKWGCEEIRRLDEKIKQLESQLAAARAEMGWRDDPPDSNDDEVRADWVLRTPEGAIIPFRTEMGGGPDGDTDRHAHIVYAVFPDGYYEPVEDMAWVDGNKYLKLPYIRQGEGG